MLFFVPARKGSIRVQDKNIRPVGGRPLIQWTFDSLLDLDPSIAQDVFVSSDDPRVLELSSIHGFHSLHRAPELAEAKSKMSDVIRSHIPDFRRLARESEEIVVLYPTSPLRTTEHLCQALDLWRKAGASDKSLMSVTPVLHRPFGLMRLSEGGFLSCLHPEGEKYYQAQGQPTAYRANGAIYIIPFNLIEENLLNSQLFWARTVPFEMDEVSSFEVDTEEDLRIADMLLRDRYEMPPTEATSEEVL